MPSVIKSGTRKARKQHRCDSYPYDGHRIELGETYHYSVNTDNGTVWEWRECPFHRAVTAYMFDECYYDEIQADSVYEFLRERWQDAEARVDRGLATMTTAFPKVRTQ